MADGTALAADGTGATKCSKRPDSGAATKFSVSTLSFAATVALLLAF
jgi:hypothetical protein